MDTNNQPLEPSTDDQTESRREIIRHNLAEIVIEVENRLHEAGLNCPVYLTVPNTGEAIATIATPLDPSDVDWSHVTEIMCRIVSKRLNGMKVRSQEVICAMANAHMGAADVTAD